MNNTGSIDVGSAENVPRAGEAPPHPRRWWALGALVIGLLVVGLDSTIVNVAMPTMSDRLGASTGDLQWIADSYLLICATAALVVGALVAIFLPRRADSAQAPATPPADLGESGHDREGATLPS
jgi:MFS family permease